MWPVTPVCKKNTAYPIQSSRQGKGKDKGAGDTDELEQGHCSDDPPHELSILGEPGTTIEEIIDQTSRTGDSDV